MSLVNTECGQRHRENFKDTLVPRGPQLLAIKCQWVCPNKENIDSGWQALNYKFSMHLN